MSDAVKLFVVTCGECDDKLIWDSATKYKECGSCSSTVMLRTSSPEEIKVVKKSLDSSSRLVFSNYMVYSVFPDEVERIVSERRMKIKQEKEDIETRKRLNNTYRTSTLKPSKGSKFKSAARY